MCVTVNMEVIKTADMIYPGTAVPSDVLTGTKFSAGTNYDADGSMANNGDLGTYTPGTSSQSIPGGYTSGGAVAGDSALVAGNIKSGASIFGVAGSVIQASGNAGAAQVLSGYSASNSSGGFSGSMPNQGSPTFTPSTSAQGIPAGYYSGGTISAAQMGAGSSGAYAIPSGNPTSFTISGLAFTPSRVMIVSNDTSGNFISGRSGPTTLDSADVVSGNNHFYSSGGSSDSCTVSFGAGAFTITITSGANFYSGGLLRWVAIS